MTQEQSKELSLSIELNTSPVLDVKTERIKFLYARASTAIAVNIVISSLFVWALWDRVD